MRTVNFKGMIVHHHDDDHFEIVSPHPSMLGWIPSFQIPPSFLIWPAKKVILFAIFTDIILSSCFLLNSSDLFACLLLGSVSVSLLLAIGYVKESFPAIFCHFMFCIISVTACIVATPVVYYNQTVCTNDVVCKSIHEWISHINKPTSPLWIYFFLAVTFLSRTFMIPISWRLIEFTAARDALKALVEKEGKEKSEAPKTIVIAHHHA